MDIDPDIANWILEFLLRQPVEDRALNSLLRALPLPNNNNPRLKKSLLLKKLESEVSRNSISDSTLELLEQLEEIEFGQGQTVSDAMKRAYCAVAVECTVKPLAIGDDEDTNNGSKFKFFEAVKRVWRGRIARMAKVVEKGGLGSEELWVWKDEIEAAVWDDRVCENVVNKSKSINSVDAIRAYLNGERERMGPSFLELVAARVKDDDAVQKILGVGKCDQEEVSGKEAPLPCVDRVTDVGNVSNEVQKGRIHLRKKLVGLRTRSRGRTSERAKIVVDSDETTVNWNYDLPCSAEVNRVREALESSSLELKAAVRDPLPDAIKLAEAISGATRKNKRHDDLVEENHVEANRFTVDGDDGVVQATGYNVSNVHPPLNKCEMKILKKRRKGRKWSLMEEDILRTGVQKYGKGNWKVILNENREIFEDRTEVDLKDKWRNLTRYGE